MATDQTTFNSIVSQIQNNQVMDVNLNNAGITDADCVLLAKALQTSTSLQTLNLQSNFIGNQGASALLKALKYNYRLTALSLNWNWNWNADNIAQINALISRNQQCAGQKLPTLQCPLLRFNPIVIKNGERLILIPAQLQMTDVNNVALNGNFAISNIHHCQFLNAQSQPITTFSQMDINNKKISLQHDGSDIAPSFNVTASYNDLETWPIPAVVNFTFAPLTSSTILRTTSTTPFTTSSSTSTTSTSTSRPFTTTPSTTTPSTTRPSTTTLLTSTSTATSAAANSSRVSGANHRGGIIGGAVAGVAALGAAVAGVVCFLRRRQQRVVATLPTNVLPMAQNPLHVQHWVSYSVPVSFAQAMDPLYESQLTAPTAPPLPQPRKPEVLYLTGQQPRRQTAPRVIYEPEPYTYEILRTVDSSDTDL